jgi:hypothetical protein
MMTSEEEIVKLRMALAEAVHEIDVLKARLDGDIPRALHWLQGKAERQRLALDGLNRRVLSLHFALRLMNRLREPVTPRSGSKPGKPSRTRRCASASTRRLRRPHNQTARARTWSWPVRS